MKTNQPNATIIYDGTCGLCGRLFPRLGWILARHGMRALPLQHSAARSISGASTEQLFTQLHVVTADRKLIGGVDALLFIASKFLLLRLLVALARIRWIHAMLDRGYRFIARNRYRIFGTCRIAQPNGSSNLPILSAFILLVCVTLVALLTRGNSPWVMMSCTAVSIYAACKWLTWRRAGRARRFDW